MSPRRSPSLPAPALTLALALAVLRLPLAHAAEAPVTSSTTASPPSDPLRLTRDVEPLAQSVDLAVDPAREEFTGSVRIDVMVHTATSSFRIHALGPVLSSITLTDVTRHAVSLTSSVADAELGLITLTAPAPIAPGNYTLAATFTNKFTHDGLGLYKTVSRGDAYLFTQFEDRHARKAFPCWDEPAFKIPWQLTVTVPAALEAVANSTPALESRDAKSGTKTIAFGRTPPMPSYLVALAVGPFEFTPVPGLPVPGRIVAPRGQAALSAEAARLSPATLHALENYFGVPYPFPKLDQIGVPEYVYGAMENAGFITYRDDLLLLDPVHPPFEARRLMAYVAAHEMAHQWFGNLVTMAWWDDLWLNESFTDWLAVKVIGRTYPEFRAEFKQNDEVHVAMRSDALSDIQPIRRPITARDDPETALDELTYNKGRAILGMIENWIGEDNFRRALRGYFAKHRWGNTTAADLWAAFDSTSGAHVSEMLAGFIDRPGIPIIEFSLQADGKLRLTQRRFTNLGSPAAAGQWQVPVTFSWFAQGRLHREQVLLKELTEAFEIPGLAAADWIYPNTAESGYYRWSLAPALNARLTSRAAALAPIERVGFIENASALLNAGQLGGADYLAILAAFAPDSEPEITLKVTAALAGVGDTFVASEQRPAFDAMRRALLRPALTRIGVKPRADEPPHLAPLRTKLFAALGITGGDPEVIAAAREISTQFLTDPASVDADLAAAALKVAAFHGDAAFFAVVLAAFERAESPAARTAFVDTLGSFHDPALAARALDYSLTDKMNSTDFLGVAFKTSATPDRRAQAVEWTMKNFDAIRAKAPGYYFGFLIEFAHGDDLALFDKFKAFLQEPAHASQFADQNIAKASGQMALLKQLREKESASVASFLTTFPSAPARDTK